jgi:hypothetical protein
MKHTKALPSWGEYAAKHVAKDIWEALQSSKEAFKAAKCKTEREEGGC